MEMKSQPTPAEVQAALQAVIRDAYKRRNMMNDAEMNAKGTGGLLARDRARWRQNQIQLTSQNKKFSKKTPKFHL